MSTATLAKLAQTDETLELHPHEYALLKARRQYEAKGRSQRWIDLRLRAVSARQELIHEWSQRGALDGEQYRELTNILMAGAFGMDVQQFRDFKHLTRPSTSLRDNMTEMELNLTILAETVATTLSRDRASSSMAHLTEDAKDAAEIVAQARRQIEAKSGRAVLSPRSHESLKTDDSNPPMPQASAA